MMKRILAIMLSLMLALSGYLSVLAENMANPQSGAFTYSLLPDGTAQIDGVNTPLEEVLIIPDNLEGYPVTSI